MRLTAAISSSSKASVCCRKAEDTYRLHELHALLLSADAVLRGQFLAAPTWQLGEIQPQRAKHLPWRAEKQGTTKPGAPWRDRQGDEKPHCNTELELKFNFASETRAHGSLPKFSPPFPPQIPPILPPQTPKPQINPQAG